MKTFTVVNFFSIKPGKMDQFIGTQHSYASELKMKWAGLIGQRMYRSVGRQVGVLVNQYVGRCGQVDLSFCCQRTLIWASCTARLPQSPIT